MSCLSKFNPHSAVLYWLKNRHDKVHPHAVKQEWSQGVFSEAGASKSISLSEHNSTKVSLPIIPMCPGT